MKLEVQATDREENKQIALGTSKLNYLDPRITVAWLSIVSLLSSYRWLLKRVVGVPRALSAFTCRLSYTAHLQYSWKPLPSAVHTTNALAHPDWSPDGQYCEHCL